MLPSLLAVINYFKIINFLLGQVREEKYNREKLLMAQEGKKKKRNGNKKSSRLKRSRDFAVSAGWVAHPTELEELRTPTLWEACEQTEARHTDGALVLGSLLRDAMVGQGDEKQRQTLHVSAVSSGKVPDCQSQLKVEIWGEENHITVRRPEKQRCFQGGGTPLSVKAPVESELGIL